MSVPMLRSLSLGEVLDTSLVVYRQLFGPLLGLAFATQALPLALGAFLDAAGGPLVHPGLWAVEVVLALILGSLGTAASTFIVSEHYLGRSMPTQQALRSAVAFLPRLVALTLATGLVVGIGLVFLIVPGVILFSGLIVGTPALVIENLQTAPDAMQRSWALSRGSRRKLLAAYIVGFLLLLIPTVAFAWIAITIAGESTSYSTWTLILGTVERLLQILIYPFLYILTTILYYDLRVRREGFDLEMLASTLQPA
jgi:hypothetical protein